MRLSSDKENANDQSIRTRQTFALIQRFNVSVALSRAIESTCAPPQHRSIHTQVSVPGRWRRLCCDPSRPQAVCRWCCEFGRSAPGVVAFGPSPAGSATLCLYICAVSCVSHGCCSSCSFAVYVLAASFVVQPLGKLGIHHIAFYSSLQG